MHNFIAAVFVLIATPVLAAGPKYDAAAGVKSSTSANAGSVSGAAYSINGKTGAVAAANLPTDPRYFGAKCDGSTDDTLALKTSLAFASASKSGIVQLPGTGFCKISGTLTLMDNVTLRGTGFGSNSTSGLIAGVQNLDPMIAVAGMNDHVENMQIIANAAGTNTSGTVIKLGAPGAVPSFAMIRNLYIIGSCGAIDVSGNQHEIRNVTAYQSAGSSCNVMKVGSYTTQAGTVDVLFDHVVVSANSSNPPDTCYLVVDAGGLFITHSDAIFCRTGTKLLPAAKQQVIWATFSSTYLGDTNTDYGFVIDTAAGGVVKGLDCSQCWAASQLSTGGAGIIIANSGGGTVTGLSFDNARVFGNAGNGIMITTNADVSITSSRICGYGGSGIYQNVGGSAALNVSDSQIGRGCSAQGGNGSYGILFQQRNANIRLSNIDVSDNAIPIAGTPFGNSIVSNIHGVDEIPASVTSAATIDLNTVSRHWFVTGTIAISTINSAWAGRQVTLITTTGPITFAKGGNICTALTSTQNMPITGTFLNNCWYLK